MLTNITHKTIILFVLFFDANIRDQTLFVNSE